LKSCYLIDKSLLSSFIDKTFSLLSTTLRTPSADLSKLASPTGRAANLIASGKKLFSQLPEGRTAEQVY